MEKATVAALIITGIWLAFWGSVIFVAIHFLSKIW